MTAIRLQIASYIFFYITNTAKRLDMVFGLYFGPLRGVQNMTNRSSNKTYKILF